MTTQDKPTSKHAEKHLPFPMRTLRQHVDSVPKQILHQTKYCFEQCQKTAMEFDSRKPSGHQHVCRQW